MVGLVVVQGHADLLEVVDALTTTRRLSGRLHGREQQADQERDDCDGGEQFDEGEALAVPMTHDTPGKRRMAGRL